MNIEADATLSACAEGYSNQNVCLSVCLSLAGSCRNKHQCQANYVLFVLKKTDFCVNLFIPSEKAAVYATLTDSTVLMFETGINVKRARAL